MLFLWAGSRQLKSNSKSDQSKQLKKKMKEKKKAQKKWKKRLPFLFSNVNSGRRSSNTSIAGSKESGGGGGLGIRSLRRSIDDTGFLSFFE